MKPEEITKAIIGSITAGTLAAVTAAADNHIMLSEWITIFLAFITTFGAVWGVPNALTRQQLDDAKRKLIDNGEVTAVTPPSVWPSSTTSTAQYPVVK